MALLKTLAKPVFAIAVAATMGLSSAAIAETGKAPKVYLTAYVPDGSQIRFLEKLEKFAKERAFITDIAPMAPDGSIHRAYLRSVDIEIIAANPFSTCTFKIGLYELKSPVPADRFLAVASELTRALQSVEDVEVVRESPAAATPERPCQ